MIRHAKASSARSSQGMSGVPAHASVGMWAVGAACFFVLLVLALGADRAAAATLSDRPLLFTFNGSDTSAGKFLVAGAIEIDQSNGFVYVLDPGHGGDGTVDKFNLAGTAQNFSATASSSLSTGHGLNGHSDLAVDNSGVNTGRIYVLSEANPLRAFESTGQPLWETSFGPGFTAVCGVAVDTAGHPWIGDRTNLLAHEYAASGSPPAEIGSVSTSPSLLCHLDLDASGNLYTNVLKENLEPGRVDKYVGGAKVATLDPDPTGGVAVDQSSATGHVFTLHDGSFNEYDSSGNLLGTYGTGIIGNAASAASGTFSGIAYDAALDRVYVSDASTNTVEVFGPQATGTAPDVSIEPSTEVGVGKATFHGTVNPQGVANSYHFEWKEGASSSWSDAESSPPVSLPVDSNDHAVSFMATGLGGGREYQVRLVGTNTDNNLRTVSSADTFSTQVASAPPSASIDQVSAITPTTAHVAATVNTREDLTEWQLELSTDPACENGFQSGPTNTTPGGHAGADTVGEDLSKLLPSERYCVRIKATNSAGSTTSETKQFTTGPVAPIQVFAAYAAPRTDTTARLNGYVNPEGGGATYRFEYSLDGSTWTALPDMQARSAHRQIVVASGLSGLEPATTYHYRFTVENGAGSVQSDEKTFETRSTAEMQLPQRGIELVNQPDKGNQNIAPEDSDKAPFVSPDGNRVIWKVFAGAPGGNTGTEVNFLSTRTESGWHSQPLAPPAEEQVGGGQDAYKLSLATPDLRTFLMRAVQPAALEESTPPAIVRIDDQYRQDVLKVFTQEDTSGFQNADMTSDGAHVIIANIETGQLEEIGAEPHEVVSIMPDGQPADCGVQPANFFGSAGGGAAGGQWRFPDYHRMATTDASRLYFEALPNGGNCAEGAGHHVAIYYRDRNAGQTVEIDPGAAMTAPELIRTTPDGRDVLFVTGTPHSSEDENTSRDIYRWDADGETYTCLTCIVDEAAVGGRIAASEDLSHVYFTSLKQLVPGHGMPGESSIYSLGGGKLNYVAPGNPAMLESVTLSSDGNVLLFGSQHGTYSQLTADEQAKECKRWRFDEKDADCHVLFRYEDSTNSVECLSCLPGGITAFDIGEMNEVALSKDGSTAAFTTHESLLPEDINNAEDVYELHNGALQLITDGETPYPSTGVGSTPRVFGMDAEGEDIFFTVVQPGLTGYEQDRVANLYDSRVGGGFPRPTATPHCSEESCQGPLAAPPPEQSVGSSGLNGAGNQPAAGKGRCAGKRGKAKSRCLHRKQRKHEKHRKQHKRQSAKRSGDNQRSDRGAK